jgi:hypothetical protein
VAEGFSPLIHANLARNQIHLSMISSTLSVGVNDRVVTQATIDYVPGFVGMRCGAYQPGSTRCAFDDLQVVGTPSDRQLIVYPFCNCRRTAYGAQPLEVRWSWAAKTSGYLDQWKAGTVLTVTVDGVPVKSPAQYWSPPTVADGEAEMFWSYLPPALEPGAHLIEYAVWSDRKLTDGLDENGDGQPDTYGPGSIYKGYVEVIVQP